MEQILTFQTLSVAFLFIFITLVVSWMLERKKKQKYLSKFNIPGPKSSLITGNFHLYIKDSVNCWDDLIKKYGQICSFYIGTRPCIILSDLDMIRKICISEASKFRNRPHFVMDRLEPLVNGLLSLRDDRWKVSRQLLTPTFSASKMKYMTTLIEGSIQTFMTKLDNFAEEGIEFDVYKHCEALTLEVIGRCAFGATVECQKRLDDKFFKAVTNFMNYTRNNLINIGLVFPGLEDLVLLINKLLMPTGKQAKHTTDKLKAVIQQRRKLGNVKPVKDLLQLMLDASGENSERKLTDDEVVGNAFSFLVAGFETTAASLAFTFYLLAKNQEHQEKLHNHLVENLSEKPTYDDVMFGLPYLDQIFNESLRCYPPVVVFSNRECSETCEINGQIIPAGSNVCVPVLHIHHKEEYWPNPTEFDPSRFSPENKPKIVPQSFMPFGIGQRNCVGMRFAQLEAKMTLAKAIMEFRFEFGKKTEDPLQLNVPNATLNPINGIYLRIVKR